MDLIIFLLYLFIIYSSGLVFYFIAKTLSFHPATFLIPWGIALSQIAFSQSIFSLINYLFLKEIMIFLLSFVLFFYGLRWKIHRLSSDLKHHLYRYLFFYLLSFFGIAFLLYSLFSFRYLWGILLIASLLPLIETNYRNEYHVFYAETLISSLFFFLPLSLAAVVSLQLQGGRFFLVVMNFLAKVMMSVFFAFVAAFFVVKQHEKKKKISQFPFFHVFLSFLALYLIVRFLGVYPFLSAFLFGFLIVQYLPYHYPSHIYHTLEEQGGIFLYTLLGIFAGPLLSFAPLSLYVLFFLFLLFLRFLLSLFFYGHHTDALKTASYLTLGATKTLGMTILVLYLFSLQYPYSLFLLSLLTFFIFFHAVFFDILVLLGLKTKRDDL